MSRMFYEVGAESKDTKNKLWSLSLLNWVSEFASQCCDKHHGLKWHWVESAYFILPFNSDKKGHQGRNLETVTEAEAMREHRLPVYLLWFAQLAISHNPELPGLGWPHPQWGGVDWALPHPPVIKKMPHILACRSIWWMHFLNEGEREECSPEMTDSGGGAGKKKDEMMTPGCVRKKQRRPECFP